MGSITGQAKSASPASAAAAAIHVNVIFAGGLDISIIDEQPVYKDVKTVIMEDKDKRDLFLAHQEDRRHEPTGSHYLPYRRKEGRGH